MEVLPLQALRVHLDHLEVEFTLEPRVSVLIDEVPYRREDVVGYGVEIGEVPVADRALVDPIVVDGPRNPPQVLYMGDGVEVEENVLLLLEPGLEAQPVLVEEGAEVQLAPRRPEDNVVSGLEAPAVEGECHEALSVIAVEVALFAVDHGNQLGLPVFLQEAVADANLDAVPHPREKGLERIGLKPVVGVNEHDIRGSRAGEPVVAGDRDSRVLLIDKRDARVRFGPSSTSLSGVVARSIVDKDHLPVRESLTEDAADTVVDVAADVVDGNYYAYGSWQTITPQSRGLSRTF